MANKTINSRVVMKHDTSTNWAKATSFVPLAGEIIIYTDLNKFKIGDGTTAVGSLEFAPSAEIFIAEYGTTTFAEITAAYNAGKVCYVDDGEHFIKLTSITSSLIKFLEILTATQFTRISITAAGVWSTSTPNFSVAGLDTERVLVSDDEGILGASEITTTELGYLDGVTSNIQTQLSGKVAKNTDITGATKTKITYDAKGLVTAGADLEASDIPSLALTKISDVTATASEVNALHNTGVIADDITKLHGVTANASELNILDGATVTTSELNILDGATVTTAELNYLDGVTSNVQTQLDNKVTKNTDITAATHTKITYDAKGLVTAGADLSATDIPDLDAAKITSGTLGTDRIADSAITNAKLGSKAVKAANIDDATITETQLNSTVNASLDLADSAVQSVALASGTTNGTLKLTVDGTATDNIAVKGLGSAAYTASTAYATSAQGTKADNAIPNPDTKTDGNFLKYDGTNSKWIAANIPDTGVLSVTAGDTTITVGGTASDPTVAVNEISAAKVTSGEFADTVLNNIDLSKVGTSKSTTLSGSKITASTIDSTQIKDGAVTNTKIVDGSVTEAKLNSTVNASLDLADSALQKSDVVDNVSTTTTNVPLSANQGKVLSDRIENLEARGRYLSTWNCTTGKPDTDPTTLPYTYKSGDYYVVSTVASSGGTNYKPNGSSYTGVASETVESAEVSANDFYIYDSTTWKLLSNTQKTVTFANIAGNATDNASLNTALGGKVDKVTGKGLSTNDFDDTYKGNVDDNTSARHTHSNKDLLDTYDQTNANLTDAVSKKHEHSNKALLDTYDQTNADITDAVSKKHEHSNKSTLDGIESTDITNWNAKSTVSVSSTGTATDVVGFITIDGVQKKLAAGVVTNTASVSVVKSSATSYEVEHGLGTNLVIVQIYDATTMETIVADVTRGISSKSTPNNWVKVDFAEAPVNNFMVLCSAMSTSNIVSGEETNY